MRQETIGARGATSVGVASLVAAGSGYLVLLVAAHVLTPAQNAEFLTFWGLLFFLFGVLGGLQNEVTRSVHVGRSAGTGDEVGLDRVPVAHASRVLPVGLMIGGVLATVVLASGTWWAPHVLGDRPWPLLAIVALATLAFSGHSAVAGTLAGSGRWGSYSRLVAAESAVRIALVAAVAFLGAGETGIAMATAAAAGTWLVLSVLLADVRSAASVRTDTSARTFARGASQAMLATAASAAIVVGFPVLLRVSTTPEVYLGSAPLVLAVQMTRAPLMIPLSAYQGVAITYFLAHRDRGTTALLRLSALVLGIGLVGATLAAAVGPWLMRTLFGVEYDVAPLVLAGLTLGAALLGILTLTGAAALAMGQHKAYATGWVAATCVTVGVLLVDAPIEARTVVALAVGPAVGVIVHLTAIHRRAAGER